MKLKNLYLMISISFWVLSGCVSSKKTTQEKRGKALATRVLIIGIDGFSVPGFQMAHHPNIDALFADGSISTTTRSVMPSVTLPNWTSHLTSSGPEQHGVLDNSWTLKKHELSPVQTDEDGYYPSVFTVLKKHLHNVKTAYYYNWKNLIYPINQKYIDQVSFEENDQYKDNYDKAVNFMEANRNDPTFVFLYTVAVDHAGHKYAWMSPQYIKTIEEVDAQIGILIQKLKKDGLYASTHFLLITDHGGKGYGHGGTSPVEMTVPWLIAGPGIAKQPDMTEPNSNTNTAAVILRLFGLDAYTPAGWIGKVPKSIFK